MIDWLPGGRFVERIRRGAFADTIAAGRVELWINHQRSRGCVASQRDGSLSLIEDSAGLWFDAAIPHTDAGDEALRLVRSSFRCCSVGMERVNDSWSVAAGERHRVIHAAGLREISIVSGGAYPTSRVAAGSLPIARLRQEACAVG